MDISINLWIVMEIYDNLRKIYRLPSTLSTFVRDERLFSENLLKFDRYTANIVIKASFQKRIVTRYRWIFSRIDITKFETDY